MNCPTCKESAKCIDTRQRSDHRYRRYACARGHKFTTREIHEADFVAMSPVSQESIVDAVSAATPGFVFEIFKRLSDGKAEDQS